MNTQIDFDQCFEALTGYPPMPWQRRLYYQLLAGHFTDCDVPTGLGKTLLLALDLLALGTTVLNGRRDYPRRLVYVVDQASAEAQAIVERLAAAENEDNDLGRLAKALRSLASSAGPLIALSTLRGQFADNGAWRLDAGRPAIIVGTVDMIGSRLLFSGYVTGRNGRALAAGLLGQHTLLALDEAHLSPAFAQTVRQIAQLTANDPRPLRTMMLSATHSTTDGPVLRLDDEDFANPVVRRRLYARKRLSIAAAENVNRAITERALTYQDQDVSVIVYTAIKVCLMRQRSRPSCSG